MSQSPGENEQDRIDIANQAEELMLRTRQVARRMQERIRKVMEPEPLPGPHAAPPPAVLVAEDEPIICDLLGLMLRGLGFQVWPAADGQEAVDLFRRHRDEIAAAVLDIHMPRLDGPATLRALRALDPQVGCVFMTGHPGDHDEEALVALGAAAVLRKPFTPDDLDAALRRLPCFARSPAAPAPADEAAPAPADESPP
jgi:CheY-like chemotaxis protein